MSPKFIITFTLIRSQFKTKSRAETVIHLMVIWWLYSVGSGPSLSGHRVIGSLAACRIFHASDDYQTSNLVQVVLLLTRD